MKNLLFLEEIKVTNWLVLSVVSCVNLFFKDRKKFGGLPEPEGRVVKGARRHRTGHCTVTHGIWKRVDAVGGDPLSGCAVCMGAN